MKEIWNNYSGIIAIIGYLLLLFVFLKLHMYGAVKKFFPKKRY